MKIYNVKNYLSLLPLSLLITCLFATNSSALLTDTTSLTVVNVTVMKYGVSTSSEDITKWQTWPPTPPAYPSGEHLKLNGPGDALWEVLIDDVHVDAVHTSWTAYAPSYKYPIPYPWTVLTAPELNAMICNVWSTDGGKTYQLVSWDYLRNTDLGKHLETPWASGMWLGTMVHSFCGFPGEEACNGRYRTNLYFTTTP